MKSFVNRKIIDAGTPQSSFEYPGASSTLRLRVGGSSLPLYEHGTELPATEAHPHAAPRIVCLFSVGLDLNLSHGAKQRRRPSALPTTPRPPKRLQFLASRLSIFMMQLTPAQNDPEALSCQLGIVIESSWLGCGWLKGQLCSDAEILVDLHISESDKDAEPQPCTWTMYLQWNERIMAGTRGHVPSPLLPCCSLTPWIWMS
eukprot:366431-Chlamydomonas_euryale.AAC.13